MGPRIAIIGFGEVGQIFAPALLAGGAAAVAVWDILFGTPAAEARIAQARARGVRVAGSAAEAAAGADVVISAVTADQALAVAREAAGFLAPGQILLDINSAAPDTKIAAARAVAAAGAAFVEGAVMATVPGPGLAVPILGGGPMAARAAALLNPLGMAITPVSEEIGRASATKLCRSIVVKGLEAILVQCRAASARWGVEAEVFASLAASHPGIDWAELARHAEGRVRQHGRRRSAEMREAAEMLAALGMDDGLCRAIAAVQAARAGQP